MQSGELPSTLRVWRSTSVFSNTHILRKDGLLRPIGPALCRASPAIRLHECRPIRWHAGASTHIDGLVVRLEDARQENWKDDFPVSCPLTVDGESM